MNDAALATYRSNLDAMVRECAKAGVPLLFLAPAFDVSHVSEDGLSPVHELRFTRAFTLLLARRYADAIAEVAERYGLPVVNHRLSLDAPYEDRFFLDPIHPAPEGNRLIAQDVERFLIESGLLGGSRVTRSPSR